MDVSPRVKLLALVGLGAALMLGAGMLLLGRSQESSSAAVNVIKPLHPVKTKRADVGAKRVAPKRTAKRPRRAVRRAVIDGMPAQLARALAAHDVVVVGVFARGGRVDEMAVKEARAGAALANAGFVAIDVFNNRQSAPLAALVSSAGAPVDRILNAPAVLVFQRPKTLYVRLNGFVDGQAVAQAAANAAAA